MSWNFGIKNSSDRTEICKISYNFLTVATIWAVMLTKRICAPKKTLRISKWVVCCFPQIWGFHKKKVDAQAVTVGSPSNDRHASSISALPAPAAQTSAGGTTCSLLPAAGSAAAQASPPHRTPIAGLAIPLLTHTCYYSLATADEPVNPRTVVLPSTWETTTEPSLAPCRSHYKKIHFHDDTCLSQ